MSTTIMLDARMYRNALAWWCGTPFQTTTLANVHDLLTVDGAAHVPDGYAYAYGSRGARALANHRASISHVAGISALVRKVGAK